MGCRNAKHVRPDSPSYKAFERFSRGAARGAAKYGTENPSRVWHKAPPGVSRKHHFEPE